MKLSETWLREWVNLRLDTEKLASQLTLSGFEVESVTPAAPKFSSVVVGKIESVDKHPEADRLSVCRVQMGRNEFVTVVCGGTNVRPDLKVAVVKVGGEIAGMKIKKASLRGVESLGMICSSRELGLSDDDEKGKILELSGDAPIGVDVRKYLLLEDAVMDINITPNRGDCLSIRGLAREVAALNHLRMKELKLKRTSVKIKSPFSVKITAKKACPHYVGRVIRDINSSAALPVWLQERLRRSGVRSVHPVVDVMNYVMLELGQPLRAFDSDKLMGGLEVRYAKENERMTLLDGQTVPLANHDLVIADKKQARAIAGVMGEAESAVNDATRHVFIESAYFTPGGIALTARRLGLQTESSYRFERGVDFDIQKRAIERATELLLSICGGKPAAIIEKREVAHFPKCKNVKLRYSQIERLLGLDIPSKVVKRLLQSVGMEMKSIAKGWRVKIPSYRFDIAIEADLIEEVVRLYGYDRIPAATLSGEYTIPPKPEAQLPAARIRNLLVDCGYHEAITYSFVDSKVQQSVDPESVMITLENPIASDMNVMRSSLWPGLLKVLNYNQARQAERVRLFEMGRCFKVVKGEYQQATHLAGLVAGDAHRLQWGEAQRKVDFYDLKGDVLALLGITHQQGLYRFVAEKHPALHPAQSAAIYKGDRRVGYLGALHPNLRRELDVEGAIYLFDLEIDPIESIRLPQYEPISRFPSVRRDLALVVAQDLEVAALEKEIRESSGQLLNMVNIFDIYAGEHIESGKKSVALGLTFQHPSRTLVEEEINQVIERVVNILESKFNAKLRA